MNIKKHELQIAFIFTNINATLKIATSLNLNVKFPK